MEENNEKQIYVSYIMEVLLLIIIISYNSKFSIDTNNIKDERW